MTLRHLISPEKRRGKLKNLINEKGFVRGIEAHNALSALIVNDLKVELTDKNKINEFDFVWESSLTDSASKGHPDIEIISFDSRLKTITEILEVTDKPMVVDGDTGGDIHHFQYLVPKLEALGVSAVIIEDKIFPKRNSLDPTSSQTQEDPEKFAEKIRAGKEVQNSDDFMIIARIESLISGKDLEDALLRAKYYLNAGIDGIMIHSKSKDPDDILEFSKEYQKLCISLGIKKPLVAVPTTYNSIYESDLREHGFNIIIYANHMLRSSYKAMENIATKILENERSLETDPMIASVEEIFEKVGFYDVRDKDKILSEIPSIIIPAAGENPELKEVLHGLPKSLLKINDKSILEHQIELFKKLGINDINVVVGYQKEKFTVKGANYISNPDYTYKGMLHSLMKARDKMQKPFIYLNGDLFIDERLIKEILERKEDIILVVDNSYLYHKHEVDKRLDAVITKKGYQPKYQKLRVGSDEIVSIGKRIPKESMTHEFIGMAKFSRKGAENLTKIYDDLNQNHKGVFHEAKDFLSSSLEDIFQELIDRGFKIAVHETNGGWIEIHNENDIKFAEHILAEVTI